MKPLFRMIIAALLFVIADVSSPILACCVPACVRHCMAYQIVPYFMPSRHNASGMLRHDGHEIFVRRPVPGAMSEEHFEVETDPSAFAVMTGSCSFCQKTVSLLKISVFKCCQSMLCNSCLIGWYIKILENNDNSLAIAVSHNALLCQHCQWPLSAASAEQAYRKTQSTRITPG